jgi:UDP-2,3-diacylglucosamine hydrolase
VPIVGVQTIQTMSAAGATCLALDAGKCLLIDGEKVIEAADQRGIAVVSG